MALERASRRTISRPLPPPVPGSEARPVQPGVATFSETITVASASMRAVRTPRLTVPTTKTIFPLSWVAIASSSFSGVSLPSTRRTPSADLSSFPVETTPMSPMEIALDPIVIAKLFGSVRTLQKSLYWK